MKSHTLISESIKDMRNACLAAKRGGLVEAWGEPRDVDGNKSRYAMTVMVKGHIDDFREYIRLAWNKSIRLV